MIAAISHLTFWCHITLRRSNTSTKNASNTSVLPRMDRRETAVAELGWIIIHVPIAPGPLDST
ncbi:fad binding domain-containing protein [Moniliophthora roreri]|nr:fad binding domain-containing protein [Moniliophthora roreri]